MALAQAQAQAMALAMAQAMANYYEYLPQNPINVYMKKIKWTIEYFQLVELSWGSIRWWWQNMKNF